MRLLLIVVIGSLMQAARSFLPPEQTSIGPAGTSLACGYLLLTAFLVGGLFKRAHLPRLTGYLATGILVGPHALGLVSQTMVSNLGVFNGVATALIALTAGAEMELHEMRPIFRTIGWMTLVAVCGTTVLLTVAVYLLRSLLPFMAGMSLVECVAVSTVLGVTMVAQSPAVVVALRDELQADGPLTRVVLGVVVISDLVVILLFAIVSPVTKAVFGGDADVGTTIGMLAWEIVGSAVVGVGVGALVMVYLRKVASSGALFVVTVCFVIAEVGQRMHFDPLLVALAAGMFIRNLSQETERLVKEIELASLPVYVTFFAVAGASIHLDALASVGIAAALFVLVRATGFHVGARTAARLAQAPEVVRRYAGFGLMPQAGLALALATLFARTFPEFGAGASALTFGVVALNELSAPVAYRWALVRAGEAGRRGKGAIEAELARPTGDGETDPEPESLAAAE